MPNNRRGGLYLPGTRGSEPQDERELAERLAEMAAESAETAPESVTSPCGVCGVSTTSANVIETAAEISATFAAHMADRAARGRPIDPPTVKWAICDDCHAAIAKMPAVEARTQALCVAISEMPTGLHQILAVGLPVWANTVPAGYTRAQVAEAWVKGPLLYSEVPGNSPTSEPWSRRFLGTVPTLEIHNARKALIALRSEPQRPPKGFAGCSVCRISELPPVGAKSELGGWTTETLNSREMAFCGPCHASAGKRLALAPNERQGLSMADVAMAEWAQVGLPRVSLTHWARWIQAA